MGVQKHRYKRTAILASALAFLVALVAAWGSFALDFTPAGAQSGGDGSKTAVGQDMTVAKGEQVKGDAVATNGSLTVLGEVDGNAVVVNGKATIEGRVHGDLTVTSGDAELGGSSRVDGNVLVVGGKVIKHDGAQVGGDISAPQPSLVEGLTNKIVPPDRPGKPGAPNDLGTADISWMPSGLFGSLIELFGKGMLSLVLLVLGLGLVAVIPRRVSLSSATLEAEPVPSLIVGAITAVMLPLGSGLVAIVLLVSIVGAPLILVLVIALCVALLFGLVTVGAWIGRAVYDNLHHAPPSQNAQLFVQVLIGMSILLGATFVPSILLPDAITALMLTLLYFAACVGIASAILSRFGTLAPPRHAQYYQRMHAQGAPDVYRPAAHMAAPPHPADPNVAPPPAQEQPPTG